MYMSDMYILGLLCICICTCSICIGSICICRYRYMYVYVHSICICSCIAIAIYKYLCAPHIFLEFWLDKIMEAILKYLCTPRIYFKFWLAIIIFLNLVYISGCLYKPLLAFILLQFNFFSRINFSYFEILISHMEITSIFRSYDHWKFALVTLYLWL